MIFACTTDHRLITDQLISQAKTAKIQMLFVLEFLRF